MTECEECARLERVKEQARAERDLSKVSDCVVLLRQHPNHAPQRTEAPRPRKARS